MWLEFETTSEAKSVENSIWQNQSNIPKYYKQYITLSPGTLWETFGQKEQ
jgi:hypothetical protein